MSGTEYYFFAPIANAHGHFRSVHLQEPFKIERWSKDKIVRLWRKLAWLPKAEIEIQIEQAQVVPRGCKTGHVVVGALSLNDSDTIEDWLQRHEGLDGFGKDVDRQLRLIGLFLCGQVETAASYWYAIRAGKEEIKLGRVTTAPIQELPVSISPSVARHVNAFLGKARWPLSPDYVNLAFEHWEESLRATKPHLEFLSLMVAIEALFNVGPQDIRYRVSRSMAVLLGKDADRSDFIFETIRHAYDVRSKLVHTGHPKGIEKVWLWHLRQLVQEAILRLHELNMKKEEFMAQLTRLGFGQGDQLRANKFLSPTPGTPRRSR